MVEEKHLKSEQYYIDLYDHHTVERCRNLIRLHSQPMKDPPLLDGKEPPKEWMDTLSKMVLEWSLMFEKGDRYLRKEETIARWMADDKEKDRFYEAAESPQGVRCLACRAVMHVIHKNLWIELDKPNRVHFMFDCPNGCLPRRAFWDNGEEYIPKPNLCTQCGSKLTSEDETTEAKFITRYTCASCGFTKTDELERTANKKEEQDSDFAADRIKFCLSKEEGEKWQQTLVHMGGVGRLVDKWKEQDKNKELYDRVAKIKKLTVIELEKLLIPVLEQGSYAHLQLLNPEIERNVIVPFTVQDSKSGRENRASEYDLQRLIKKVLEDTNWRLMTDGVSYRLGVLSGRLRGYESEEDLMKLIQVK